MRVKDVAIRRGAGTASLGLARYYVLVEGPRADGSDDLVIEFEQARRSALAGLTPPSALGVDGRGDRIAHAQGLQLAQGDVFYGSVEFDGMSSCRASGRRTAATSTSTTSTRRAGWNTPASAERPRVRPRADGRVGRARSRRQARDPARRRAACPLRRRRRALRRRGRRAGTRRPEGILRRSRARRLQHGRRPRSPAAPVGRLTPVRGRYPRAIAVEPDNESAETLTAPAAVRVRRALLSVTDKRGVVEFARGLADLGVELVSTGGTATELEGAGLDVRAIEDFTGFPEIMDGRVKTLHPKLYAGLLAVRDDQSHIAAAAEHEIEYVDLVCVNLYPFERSVARRLPHTEIVENIDIGGPTMIRAAAKNHAFAAVVTSPESYDAVLDELRMTEGLLSMPTRESLAAEAFAYTARYDTAVARWFAEKSEDFPPLHVRAYEKVADLPYGENPHQRAAYYQEVGARMHVLSMVRQHHGKQLSFNNLLDLDSARNLVRDFSQPACVIVKHNNPCGVAVGATALEAYERAFATDPLSAFGGVISFNRPIDDATAERLSEQFVEVLFAPGYDDRALEILTAKPSIRILEDNERREPLTAEPEFKQVMGGLLVQDRDLEFGDRTEMEIVTKRQPTDAEWRDMMFAWKVCKHVRSNAIVLARDEATAGIGAGQMSRVDSVRLAIDKSRLESLSGAVLASDAFFPFSDGPEIAIGAGVTAIIQPGGSRRDPEVVDAADEAGVAMVFTSRRHFRH